MDDMGLKGCFWPFFFDLRTSNIKDEHFIILGGLMG